MDNLDIGRSLGRLEGKMDTLIDLHDETRRRLSAVEKKVWYGAGIASVITFIAARFTVHY